MDMVNAAAVAAAAMAANCIGKGDPDACEPTAASTDATDITGDTPETATTPSRSRSPSSDGGASLTLPKRGDAVSGSGGGSPLNEGEASASQKRLVADAAEAEARKGTEEVGARCLSSAEPKSAAGGSEAVPAKSRAADAAAGEEAGLGGDSTRASDTPASTASTAEVEPKAGDSADGKGEAGDETERSSSAVTSGGSPGTVPQADASAEATAGGEAAAPTAGTRGKEGGGGASNAEAGAVATATAAIGVGGAKGSRAKIAGRNGHGAMDRWGHDGNGHLGASSAAGSQAQMQMALGGPAFALLPAAVPTLGPTMNSFSDRRIIEVLAAPEATHRRLLRTARRVPEILADPSEHQLVTSTELYGSLSLDMAEPNLHRPWKQDWASYYVNGRSDVDFVVQTRHKVAPSAVAQRLLKKGPWRMVGQVQVHKFASTQFTLLGSFEEEDGSGQASEVYLDITVIEQKVHFNRFKSRQEAFRKVFMEVRACIEAQFNAQGALAFDAYIHLLKAFAAKVPGNGLTGFQATCIGLFTLQIAHFRMKPTQSIALSLFEGFLRFCVSFYSDMARPADLCWHSWSYRQYAIDLSGGGRWLPRMSTSWHSELYFMAEEVKMHTRPDERMNVTHSLDPARVCAEALALLNRAFFPSPGAGAPAAPWSSGWNSAQRERLGDIRGPTEVTAASSG